MEPGSLSSAAHPVGRERPHPFRMDGEPRAADDRTMDPVGRWPPAPVAGSAASDRQWRDNEAVNERKLNKYNKDHRGRTNARGQEAGDEAVDDIRDADGKIG